MFSESIHTSLISHRTKLFPKSAATLIESEKGHDSPFEPKVNFTPAWSLEVAKTFAMTIGLMQQAAIGFFDFINVKKSIKINFFYFMKF